MIKSLKLTILCVLIMGGFCSSVFAQNQKKKDLNITIYNQNMGLIQENRIRNVKKGLAHIRFTDMAQFIIPGSIIINFNGKVIDKTYHQQPINLADILHNYFLHKNIRLIKNSGQVVTGTLISANWNQVIVHQEDGSYTIIPNVSNYQISMSHLPDNLALSPYLDCFVKSNKKGLQNFEITYQTRGIRWNAIYSAVINNDYDQMNLNAEAFITNNTGTDYRDANVRLVAGTMNTNRVSPVSSFGMANQAKRSVAPSISQKSFADYHVYTISQKINLLQHTSKQLNLFSADKVNIQKKYIYQDNYNGAVGKPRHGKIEVEINFKNDSSNQLGKPMPAGLVNIYKKDGDQLELIGQDHIDHTPVKAHLNWKVGQAFDLSAREVLKDIKHISNKVSERTYEITFSNQKKKDVTIQVDRSIGTHGEIIKASQKYTKVNATMVHFEVKVPAKGEKKLSYTVRNSY